MASALRPCLSKPRRIDSDGWHYAITARAAPTHRGRLDSELRQRSQIECENTCRPSTAASAAGEGLIHVASICTRLHHAHSGSNRPASNADQICANTAFGFKDST